MTWGQAFRRQAESDYQVFKRFSATSSEVPVCHRLHFLQMATEKLAKSFLIGTSTETPKKSHFALVRFLRVVSSSPDIRDRFKFGNNPKQFKAYIDSLIPLAEQIEALVPVGGDIERLNPEYPWLNGQQEVMCPADYDFSEFTKSDLVRFAKFIDSFLAVTT